VQAVGLVAMREATQSIRPCEIRALIMLLSTSIAASSDTRREEAVDALDTWALEQERDRASESNWNLGELVSQTFLGSARRMRGKPAGVKECRAVAMRMMKPPALVAYEDCFVSKVRQNGSEDEQHDWSIPGAEIKAQLDCWCQTNLTDTMTEYQCCDHSDIFPMCSVQCQPDCQSDFARECIRTCPAMCFEASEYIVDKELCKKCDWMKCWPALDCLLQHAEDRVETGDLARTCHETDFAMAPQLKEYWQCWKDIPKHSSHWNILSGIIHCICREGMQKVAEDTHCCDSVLYGGGACDVECISETDCASQEAQTCIHGCQRKCPALELAPSESCVEDCLKKDSPCRKYTSCRPPATGNYICPDGRWPHSSSGCCENNETGIVGCPRLCEQQRMWRLDRTRGIPWWARYHPQKEMIAQCTCHECPDSMEAAKEKTAKTIEEDLWENGQRMLLDIARREGLMLGPNREMQELMNRRNREIVQVTKDVESDMQAEVDEKIGEINQRYSNEITRSARTHGDDLKVKKYVHFKDKDGDSDTALMITVIVCTCVLLIGFAFTVAYVAWKKNQGSDITQFETTQQVVIGQPVSGEAPSAVPTGAPVTVSAPMKNSSTKVEP